MGIFIKNGKRGFQFLAVTIICLIFSISAVDAQSSGPTITVTSPINTTYATTSIDLNVSANETIDIWWYELDGTDNVTFTPNTSLTGLQSGHHNITVWANDTGGNIAAGGIEIAVEVWNAIYDRGDYNSAHAIAVDPSGNVYVTGNSYLGSYSGYHTIKYNSSGNEVWNATYDGGGVATGIAVDSSGNVYVTGFSPPSGNHDYHTIKYNSSGNEVWNATYDVGYGNSNDYAESIAVDSSGNVYVTGYSSDDYHTIKYNSSGNEVWDATYDGGGVDYAYAIAVDSSGNVYVTGKSSDDYHTIKYNSSGNEVWNATYDGGGANQAYGIAVDSSGNVYVTGYSSDDYHTIKYNSSGNEVWNATYDGGGANQAYGIAVDSSGNVYVTGKSWSSLGYDYHTIKYNQQTGPVHFTVDTPPTIVVTSPQNNTYKTTSIDLNVSANETVDTWWYQYNDNGTNITFTPNITINAFGGGVALKNITIWANDTVGNVNSTTVYFTSPITVCSSECGYASIKDAVGNATEGDTIYVLAGTYTTTSAIWFNKSLNVIGEGMDVTILNTTHSGPTRSHIFDVWANYTNISGFTLIGNAYTEVIRVLEPYFTLSNVNITNGTLAINLGSASNSTLVNITANWNRNGITLYGSKYCNLTNITANFNGIGTGGGVGVYLESHSDNNILKNINASYNGLYGIEIYNSDNNTIVNNTASSNYEWIGTVGAGILLLTGSDFNIVTGNNLSNNNLIGVYIIGSDSNTITENTIFNNSGYGVRLWSQLANNNIIYHNNFINNSIQVLDNGSSTSWDNGNPSGGNYWSDYDESNEGCDDTNADGFCDSLYNISGGGNQDRYPFTIQDGWLYVTQDTAPPLLSFDPSTPVDYYTSSSGNITIKILHNETDPDTLILNWNGTDEFYSYLSIDSLGGGGGGSLCSGIDQAGSYTSIWKGCLDEGIYTYHAWANDTAGNSNSTEMRGFIVSATLDIKIEVSSNELHDDSPPADDYTRAPLPPEGVYPLNSSAILRFDGNADSDLKDDPDDYDLYNHIVIIDQANGDIQFAYKLTEHETYSNSGGGIDAGEVVTIKGDKYVVTDNDTSDNDIELGPAIAKTLPAATVDKDNAVIISGTKKILYGNDGYLYFYDGNSLVDSFNATGKSYYPYKANSSDIISVEFKIFRIYVISANSSEAKVTMVEKSQIMALNNDEEAVMGYSSIKVGDVDWYDGGVFSLSDPITLIRGETIDLSDTYYQLKYTSLKQFDIKREKTTSIASGTKLKSTTAPGEDFLVSGASITLSVVGVDIKIEFNSQELHDDYTAQDDYTQSTFAAAGYSDASVNPLNSTAVLRFDGNADSDLRDDPDDYDLYNHIVIIDQDSGDIQFAKNWTEHSTYSGGSSDVNAGDVVTIKGDKYVVTDNDTSDNDIEIGPAIAKKLTAMTVNESNAVTVSGTKKVLYGNDGGLWFYDEGSLADGPIDINASAIPDTALPYKLTSDDIESDAFTPYEIYVVDRPTSTTAVVTLVEKSQLVTLSNDEEGGMGYSSVKVGDVDWFDGGNQAGDVFFLGDPISLVKGETIDLSDTYYSLEYTTIKEFDILRKKTSSVASGTTLKNTKAPGKDFLKADIIVTVYAVIAPSDTTKPIITITSPQNTSYSSTSISLNVSADEAIDTWIYNLNSVGNTTFTPNTTITGEEGLNSIVIYANDTAGNLGSKSVYFTVDTSPAPSPPCCGGGGPGKGKGSIIKKIMGGKSGVAHFDPAKSPVSEITIKTKNTVYNVRISVENLEEKPYSSMANPPGRAFGYMKISKSKIYDSNIEEAEIKFQVDVQWFSENDIDPDTVSLYRYKDGKWEELDTELLETDSEYVHFAAITPGFSHFSITGKPGSGYRPQDTLPKEPVVTSPPVEMPWPIKNADSTIEEMRKQTALMEKQLEEMKRQSRMMEAVSRVVVGIENMLKTILNFFGIGKS